MFQYLLSIFADPVFKFSVLRIWMTKLVRIASIFYLKIFRRSFQLCLLGFKIQHFGLVKNCYLT